MGWDVFRPRCRAFPEAVIADPRGHDLHPASPDRLSAMTHAELDALLPQMTESVSKVRARCFSILGEQSGETTVDKFIALLLLDIVRARLAPPRAGTDFGTDACDGLGVVRQTSKRRWRMTSRRISSSAVRHPIEVTATPVTGY